jgi:hypothetical protein
MAVCDRSIVFTPRSAQLSKRVMAYGRYGTKFDRRTTATKSYVHVQNSEWLGLVSIKLQKSSRGITAQPCEETDDVAVGHWLHSMARRIPCEHAVANADSGGSCCLSGNLEAPPAAVPSL